MPSAEILVIAGPTGVGKSEIAIELAERIGGEIVNCDSLQIYRHFDIGTAKPPAKDRALVPHHLFDVVEPDDDFNAAEYAAVAGRVCEEIVARGHRPIVTGGTGFYLRSLLGGLPELPRKDEAIRERIRRISESTSGRELLHRRLRRFDPESAARIAAADRHRIERAWEVYLLTERPISAWKRPDVRTSRRPHRIFAVTAPRERLVARLDARVERMYGSGLVEETRTLLARYDRRSRPFESIGYREAVRFLDGETDLASAIAETKRRTRAYAKRQITWLRGEHGVVWLDMDKGRESVLREILESVNACE